MRKIKKGKAPSRLTGKESIDAKEAIKTIIDSGKIPASSDFKSDVYGHADVKDELKKCHKNRCAYCGCSLQGDFAPVEHYRPKTGYKVERNTDLIKPGYHWLAYEWDNLLCSCDECNSTKFKGNLFPLVDETTRNIGGKDISKETPLLLNPAIDDPDLFFEYDTWVMVPKSGIGSIQKLRANSTIDILCLNGERKEKGQSSFPRASLVNERKEKWDMFCQIVKFTMEQNPDYSIDDARKIVVEKLDFINGPYGFMFEKWR